MPMDKNSPPRRRAACSCAGCFGMLLFMLSAAFLGYLVREWEGNDWDRAKTRASLWQRATIHYDNLRGWLTSTPPPDRGNMEPDTEPEEIPANYVTSGDEAYARARQAWYKASNATGAERERLRQAVLAELATAAKCYESASAQVTDEVVRASLREKIKAARKSMDDLRQSR